jgi:hypothetical protein
VSGADSNQVVKTINACRACSFALSQVTSPILCFSLDSELLLRAILQRPAHFTNPIMRHPISPNYSQRARAVLAYFTYASTPWKRARSIAAHVDFSPAVYDATAPTIGSAVQSSSSPTNTLRNSSETSSRTMHLLIYPAGPPLALHCRILLDGWKGALVRTLRFRPFRSRGWMYAPSIDLRIELCPRPTQACVCCGS